MGFGGGTPQAGDVGAGLEALLEALKPALVGPL